MVKKLMRKFCLIFFVVFGFVSCASIKMPEYVVELKEDGDFSTSSDISTSYLKGDDNYSSSYLKGGKDSSTSSDVSTLYLKGTEDSSSSYLKGDDNYSSSYLKGDKNFSTSYLKRPAKSSVKIIQISDFHSNDFGKNEEKLISKIREARPDVIFITGDLFEYKLKEKGIKNVEYLLAGIEGLCPFFYVSGNHEYDDNHTNECVSLIEDYGGTILSNRVVQTNVNGIDFVIAGVEDPIYFLERDDRKKDGKNDEKYIPAIHEVAVKAAELSGDFYVLLAHRPEYIDEYKADGVFDLILSGHAHGGQWRFPPLINGLYAPGQGLFPKYAGGRYDFSEEKKSSVFIVSRGLSYQNPFFPRLFNGLELVEIIVKPVAVEGTDFTDLIEAE